MSWLVGRLVVWEIGCLVVWEIGRLGDWSFGCLGLRLAGEGEVKIIG